MQPKQLKPKQWYWVRRDDRTIVPYRFNKLRDSIAGRLEGEFFVGSMICVFPLSSVVGEAQMPTSQPNGTS